MIFEITQKGVQPLRAIAGLLQLKSNIRLDREVYVLSTSSAKARGLLIAYLDKFPLKTKKKISYDH